MSEEVLPEGRPVRGVFRIIVDKQGRARMPILVSLEGELSAEPIARMQEAIRKWRFKRPRLDGRPVFTVVDQPIVFDAG